MEGSIMYVFSGNLFNQSILTVIVVDREGTTLSVGPEDAGRLSTDVNTDIALKTFLRTIFSGQIHTDYPVVPFIEKVFKYSRSSLPAKDYVLPVEACIEYLGATEDKNCYAPLKKIFDCLRDQVYSSSHPRPLLAQFVGMHDHQADPKMELKLKPDFYFSTQLGRNHQHWLSCLGYGEVKRRTIKAAFDGDGTIDTSLFASVRYEL